MENKVILLADDEGSFRKSFAFLLEKEGYTIRQCDNGVEAIMTANNESIDLIIIDIRMPNINGISALESINKLKKPIPTIIITAYTNDTISSRFPENVIKTYIKPFEISDMISYINEYFETNAGTS